MLHAALVWSIWRTFTHLFRFPFFECLVFPGDANVSATNGYAYHIKDAGGVLHPLMWLLISEIPSEYSICANREVELQ